MMRTVSKLGRRQELDARNAEISIDGAAASSREPSPVDDAQVDTHEGGVTSWSDRVFLTQNTLSGSGINFPDALEPKRVRSTRRPHTRIGMSDEEERLPQAEVSNVEIHQLPRELLRLMTAGRHPKLEQQILKNSTGRQLEIAFVRAPSEDFEKLIRLTNFGEFDDGSHRKEKTQSVLDDPPSDDEPPLRFLPAFRNSSGGEGEGKSGEARRFGAADRRCRSTGWRRANRRRRAQNERGRECTPGNP